MSFEYYLITIFIISLWRYYVDTYARGWSWSMPFAVEQIKGSAQTQERIINAYRETRGDLELATKLSLGNDGMTSTSTLYENYLDGFHSNHLESGEHSHLPSSSVPPSYCWMMIRFRLIGRGHLFLFPSLSLSLSLSASPSFISFSACFVFSSASPSLSFSLSVPRFASCVCVRLT